MNTVNIRSVQAKDSFSRIDDVTAYQLGVGADIESLQPPPPHCPKAAFVDLKRLYSLKGPIFTKLFATNS